MGKNEYGEFGNGETNAQHNSAFVTTNSDVRQITFGTHGSAYILKNDGSVWTCGRNDCYQLGDGTMKNRSTPVKIADDVAIIGGGSEFMLMLKTDGTLWGCGNRWNLGLGGGVDIQTPVKIRNNVRYFSCGFQHYAYITADNKLYTAGNGANGQLGTGKAEATLAVGSPYIMENVRSVSCGAHNTLIVDCNGALYSCGRNEYGELLSGKASETVYAPQRVVDSGVSSAAVYMDDALYITTDGSLYAAGNNLNGQFGLRWSMIDPALPLDEQRGKIYKIADNVTDAAIGWQNIMYRTTDGTLYMCGGNVTEPGKAYYGPFLPMLTGVQESSIPWITPVIIYGDTDENGTLTAADAATVLQKVLNSEYTMPVEQFADDYLGCTDVDGNGTLMASDSALILQKALNGSFKLPIE